jgi:uncharacterized RDD family membrane protein YckC
VEMGYEIKKTEKREMIHAPYARRVFAFIVDFGVFAVFYIIVKFFLEILPVAQGDFWSALLGFVVLNFFFLLYLGIMESSRLQGSLGKYFLGMKVVNGDGKPCSLGVTLARNAVKLFTCSWLIAIVFHFATIRDQLEIAVLLSITTNPIWYDFMSAANVEKYGHRLAHDEVARTQVVMG